jgi:hypothetical protein
LGYTSPKALQIAKDATDLHQADELIAAMLETGSEVLAKHYVDTCGGFGSCQGFVEFLSSSCKPNICLLRDIVYEYCLGYMILKGGIRQNDKNYVYCGKDL